MTTTTTTTTTTKQYDIALDHLELDFSTDDGTSPSRDEQQRIIAEQMALPTVITIDAGAHKEEIIGVVADVISDRCDWCVKTLEINWFKSGVDEIDASALSQEEMGKLYETLRRYTCFAFDELIESQNEAIDDFISNVLGLEDLDNEIFDVIDAQLSFDFHIKGFDVERYIQARRAKVKAQLNNL